MSDKGEYLWTEAETAVKTGFEHFMGSLEYWSCYKPLPSDYYIILKSEQRPIPSNLCQDMQDVQLLPLACDTKSAPLFPLLVLSAYDESEMTYLRGGKWTWADASLVQGIKQIPRVVGQLVQANSNTGRLFIEIQHRPGAVLDCLDSQVQAKVVHPMPWLLYLIWHLHSRCYLPKNVRRLMS